MRLFRDPTRDITFPLLGTLMLFGVLVFGGLLYINIVGGSSDKLMTAMFIDAMMVIGLQIYIGNTGVLSFGHIGFGAIAGYTFAVLAIEPDRQSTVIRNAPWDLNEVHLIPFVAGVVAEHQTLVFANNICIALARSGANSCPLAATDITLTQFIQTH